jgi:DNA-binding response OmpR family regulator
MHAAGPCTVLIVDDERDYVDTLAMLLQASGYRVLTAPDGELALQALRSHAVQVVLTDLAMPVVDGFRLLEAIRAEPACADVLVMAISGWGGRDTHARCTTAGFDAYFVKPCDLRDLLWTIAAGVARQSRAAEQLPSGSLPL